MKKLAIVVGVVIIVVICAVLIFMPKGPDPKQYEYLANPAISEKPDQNMLVVEVKGDPNVVGAKAIQLLYKAFYSLKGVPKSFKMVAPRARWPIGLDTPKDQWVGVFGLPIPDSITTVPDEKNPDSLKIYITKWQYGTVAEILHTGPYSQEQPTEQRLNDYISQQGYKAIGEHEEEYIKGPGMFGPGNPDRYLTIIRYRVDKAAQ
jgi:hypothetical protein